MVLPGIKLPTFCTLGGHSIIEALTRNVRVGHKFGFGDNSKMNNGARKGGTGI